MKLRFILLYRHQFYIGKRAKDALFQAAQRHELAGVARIKKPIEKLKFIFQSLPAEGYGNRLHVYKEPKGINPKRSRYIQQLRAYGLHKPKKFKFKKAPIPAAARPLIGFRVHGRAR